MGFEDSAQLQVVFTSVILAFRVERSGQNGAFLIENR